jgi:hypothetical protein
VYLRETKVVPPSVSQDDTSPIDQLPASFAQYLREQRGLRPTTLEQYLFHNGSALSTNPRLSAFAIRTLERLYRAGADVERHLPGLATYLGHIDAGSTYWYLTATPKLLLLASHRLDRKRKEIGR